MPSVVIAGGGPAGLAAAIALAERGIAATLIDPAGGEADQRGELLPAGASAIMERLGLRRSLKSAPRIDRVVSHWGTADLQAHGAHPSLGAHGWGMSRQALSLDMLHRVRALGGQVLRGRLTKVLRMDTGWDLGIDSPSGETTLHPDFVIDATGRPAQIARRHGALLLTGSDLLGVVWQTPGDGHATMMAEATPLGWWYAVPHRYGRTVGFMTTAIRARTIAQDSATFLRKAQSETQLISLSAMHGPPRLMDSRSTVLSQMSGQDWMATGDAAAAFDPIASQGLFNALSGGFFAGQAAADAMQGDKDAPHVYAALAARTAERTHQLSPLQYAARPYDTPFWRGAPVGQPQETQKIPA